MIEKIYQELVLIRSELQKKNTNAEIEGSNCITEKIFYPNQATSRASIQFSLPYDKWCELRKTRYWSKVESVINSEEREEVYRTERTYSR